MASSTKEALGNALKKMLSVKPIDKITVKDLVEECGVNRQTFYYHFQDIYDLLRFFLEFLRGDYVEPMLWGLKSAQVTALVSFTVALALFVWVGMRKKPAA